jgi:hypothetical protein
MKLNTLKNTLKQCGCHVHGNKEHLIVRINIYYRKIYSAIKIQKVFRGFIVRESERMRGPAMKDISICTNNTDFETMNPLENVPRKHFFSYMTENEFVYGFNIYSLMAMFKHFRKLINPYTREDIPFEILQCLFSLYKKILILYPEYHPPIDTTLEPICIESIPLMRVAEVEEAPLYNSIEDNQPPLLSESNTYYPEISVQNEFCNSLFERIRNLVNGEANPQWFLQLKSNDLYRFYYYYYIWWTHSSDLSEELKNEICSVQSPFIVLNELDEDGTTEYYQSICLSVMESMIYTGVDECHCKLGAEQVLMILTVVSRPARRVWAELFNRWS